ncbi:M67 family metallopeptidase [Pseudonocardia tropica]|uniref:M67 family metallopeptidase n=1 Tax=Pseudonocardia tropica TaxID=681289 RepID=A0ABV1JTI9_9PSEU
MRTNVERPLVLPAQTLGLLRRLARSAHPREACGVLFGNPRTREVLRVAELTNVADHHLDFAFDPQEQLDWWVSEEAEGRVPLVLWHSHPTAELYPSPADATCMAMHARLDHLIVSRWTARAFRWRDGVMPVELRSKPGWFRVG